MNRPSLWLLWSVTILCGSLLDWCAPICHAAPLPPSLSDQFSEERPTRLVPKAGRTSAEEDRIAAAALFAHARVLVQRQDYAGALRRLERAWRLDDNSLPILNEIVPLAFELKHSEEAARYAILAAERDPKDAATLIRLSAFLADQKQRDRAAKMYEQALSLQEKIPVDAGVQLLHLELGRYYLSLDENPAVNKEKAAAAFSRVRETLDGKNKNVAEQLKKALGNKPDLLPVLLADGFLQAGRLDDAEALYRRANDLQKNADLLAFRLARVAAERGDIKAALENLGKYFDANLSEAGTEPHELLGQLLRKQNFDASAARQELISQLEKQKAKFASNVPLTFSLAKLYVETKQFEKAETVYLELLKRQQAVEVFEGLLEIYRQQTNAEKTLATLGQAALKLGSLEPLSDTLEDLAKNREFVEQLIKTARTQRDAKPATLADGVAWALSQLAIVSKHYDAADEFLEVAVAGGAALKPQMLMNHGLQMFIAAEADRSAKVLRRAIEEKVLPENNQSFYFYLAGALALADKTDAALEAARKAIAAGPKTVRIQSRLSWISYHAKRYAEAEKGYRELLKEYDADHTSTEVRDSLRETRLILSNLCVLQKRLPEAEEWLEQVLDEFPEDVGAANDLGYLWADQNKNLQRALAHCERAVAAEPKNKAYRDSLGWAYFRLNRFPDAVRELQLAVAEEADADGVIFDHLGDALAKLNQRDQALDAWKKATDSFKKEKDDEKLRQTEAKIKMLSK